MTLLFADQPYCQLLKNKWAFPSREFNLQGTSLCRGLRYTDQIWMFPQFVFHRHVLQAFPTKLGTVQLKSWTGFLLLYCILLNSSKLTCSRKLFRRIRQELSHLSKMNFQNYLAMKNGSTSLLLLWTSSIDDYSAFLCKSAWSKSINFCKKTKFRDHKFERCHPR